MNRISIKEKVIQNIFNILKELKKQDLVIFKDLQKYKVTEIYQTTDVVGILAFEIEGIADLQAKEDIKSLNSKAMSIVKDKYSKLIYFIAFLSESENSTIYKIRVCLNYSEIDDYITDLENICFKSTGFKDVNTFLCIFDGYGLDKIIQHEVPSLQSYKYSEDAVQLKFGFKNSTFENKMKKLRQMMNCNSSFVNVASNIGQPVYLFKINGKKVLIKLKKEKDVSLVIFDSVKVKGNKDIKKHVTEVKGSNINKTHKFV